MPRPPRYQFSLTALLLVTTVVALVMGALAWLEVPFDNSVVRGFLGSYFIFLGVWVVTRGPRVLSNIRDLRQRRQALADARATLAEDVRRKKAESAVRKETEVAERATGGDQGGA